MNGFPAHRQGQMIHVLAMNVSGSVWHGPLSDLRGEAPQQRRAYWLWPCENYKALCPYLAGGYEQVSSEIGRYLSFAYRTFIVDGPAKAEELTRIHQGF